MKEIIQAFKVFGVKNFYKTEFLSYNSSFPRRCFKNFKFFRLCLKLIKRIYFCTHFWFNYVGVLASHLLSLSLLSAALCAYNGSIDLFFFFVLLSQTDIFFKVLSSPLVFFCSGFPLMLRPLIILLKFWLNPQSLFKSTNSLSKRNKYAAWRVKTRAYT